MIPRLTTKCGINRGRAPVQELYCYCDIGGGAASTYLAPQSRRPPMSAALNPPNQIKIKHLLP
eukprot:3679832-Rhodomonas_salina.2